MSQSYRKSQAVNSPPLAPHHRHQLEIGSGISSEVIAARGYWTANTMAQVPPGFADYQLQTWMFPMLVIPQWNTVGRVFGHILKPDHPRRDRDGKVIKYEAQPGSPLGFDSSPTMTSRLRDPRETLYVTEGSKKADAMASRGLLCISLNGVYAFLHKKLVVSELDEIACEGRTIRIIFDSDVMEKASVADALNRLAGAAVRRDGKVEMVILPDNGKDKVGADDYFVAGGTPEELDALCRPWNPIRRPINIAEYADPYERIAHLERLAAAQAELLRNPALKDKPRMVGFATITLAASEASLGKVEPDGRVRLTASKIANDFRPKPAKGEALAETNPQDESIPLTSRDNAKSTLKHLIEARVIDAEFVAAKRQHETGDWYADTDILVRVTDVPGALLHLASYDTRKPRNPYTRQAPCRHCGEVHARTVQTTHTATCHGCGGVTSTEEPIRIVPVPPAQNPDATEEQRERLRARDGQGDIPPESASRFFLEAEPMPVNGSPSPVPSNYVSRKNLEAEPPEHAAYPSSFGDVGFAPTGTHGHDRWTA